MSNIFIDKLTEELEKKEGLSFEESILLRRKILTDAFDMLIYSLKVTDEGDSSLLETISSISEFIRRMRSNFVFYPTDEFALGECLIAMNGSIANYRSAAERFFRTKNKELKADADLYNGICHVIYIAIGGGFIDDNFSNDDFEILWNSFFN
ncbi:MAG: hypothetical protein Q4D77_03175 [Peptostreptococcaceae bacterium]|nr:hypothetical protein [Peptostreptococcaceae bacterium]